jgi:N6-L-threonylcarbamoyladenine synthase
VLVLGIETSCDETSAAVVESGRLVRSNVVSSQIDRHAPFGGVVPEIASRQHVLAISHVVRTALAEAHAEERDLDALAVTYGPGLAGALLVGLSFARGLALGLGIPLIPVNHLEGHLHSVWLTVRRPLPAPPDLPMMTLIVSGGHTELVLVRDHGDYEVAGRTVDDAAGEAFDKVARLLGLPYPGGPSIQRAAGDAVAPINFPRAWLPRSFDFSFSGLKTAALHRAYEAAFGRSPDEIRGQSLPRVEVASHLSAEQVANLAAGFQESVVDVLVTKALAAAQAFSARSIAVVGGVAANRALRERFTAASPLPLHISPPEFSTDNAAMIAGAAYFIRQPAVDLDVQPALSLGGTPVP